MKEKPRISLISSGKQMSISEDQSISRKNTRKPGYQIVEARCTVPLLIFWYADTLPTDLLIL